MPMLTPPTKRQSPKFMAYYPASASYPSILGELFSAAFTAPAFSWICSPVVTELETIVLDWLTKLLHLPDCFLSQGEGGGVIQGSASEAIATAIVAARERYLQHACNGLEGSKRGSRMGELRHRLVVLGSDQNHSATAKGALIAGVRYKAITTHAKNEFALTGLELECALGECQAEGIEPFYLTVNLGTTNTCAIDHMEDIAQVLRRWPEIWVHVDAAYVGSALCCEEYQHLAAQLEPFDSITVNIAKWMLVSFDAR